MLVGGDWIGVKTFIYPIASDEYDMFSILRTPLPSVFSGYVLYIILFTYTAFNAIYKLWKNPEFARENNIICMAIALSGLGALTYYVNRTATACLAVSRIQFVMLLGMYAEQCLKIEKVDYKTLKKQMMYLFASFHL